MQSFKARQMVPGKDTISVIAMHYGFTPSHVRDIIMKAGARVTREDGFTGTLLKAKTFKFAVWSDGRVGVNPAKTKLTRQAIKAVSQWAWQNAPENLGDTQA
jgi:hypothetical protein